MIYTVLKMKNSHMNNLELNTEITSEFQGIINGNIIDNADVYDAMIIIIDLLKTNLNEPNITKPNEFINDLINAFNELYINDICEEVSIYNDYTLADTPEYFIWLRDAFLEEIMTGSTTFKGLSEITYYTVEIEDRKEFRTLHERLTSDFYIS